MAMESDIFSMSQKALLATLFRRHGLVPALCGGVVAATLCVLAFALHDVRYAILALMAVFILIPMTMALLYFNHALHPDVAFNTLPHRLRIEGDIIEITIFPKSKKRDRKKNKKDKNETDERKPAFPDLIPHENDSESDYESRIKDRIKDGEDGEDEDDEKPIPVTRTVKSERLGRYTASLDSVIIPLKGAHGQQEGFLYIPQSAFGSALLFKEFMEEISSRIRENYERQR